MLCGERHEYNTSIFDSLRELVSNGLNFLLDESLVEETLLQQQDDLGTLIIPPMDDGPDNLFFVGLIWFIIGLLCALVLATITIILVSRSSSDQSVRNKACEDLEALDLDSSDDDELIEQEKLVYELMQAS
ncbi:uncharacterized protein GVI51_G09449 [Nakaseomyces glabratus]|mgnify:CR=1 FL=1|uniref:Uncharacterized protein n=2 Tax=Candida glabrata TaxID=5478 RepID=Q6FSL7_CANGA|nr:uncharacterized protein CAGL0G09603g [Nakaseomyces glabratus]KAH7587082.1 hypothetical protein J7298_02041 [Nakaseomyces glabratus]KAH7589081.1 hypothetical protein J7297_02033 [Nakaseomyces glabratus]KAH7593495.1 hypothetical protein J7296_02035 [Nakaseomyces glabratus]KAH7602532.1 hypothetical protein J7295_02048 [Nakaseomyces glabratus]KAH7603534.1 hypothetical protein J7294_02034 [Nakaseomyces glabratus]|eukprot:XP_446777.1 uncharacterized protein CAGL0G09603g [[Candida] glabrata]